MPRCPSQRGIPIPPIRQRSGGGTVCAGLRTSRVGRSRRIRPPIRRFTDPRYHNPPAIDESRALPTLAAAAATAAPAPLPTAAPTAAPSYEPAYVPSGGYQAAYLSAHPEADLSPRPGAYQQAPQPGQAPGGQQAYPTAPAALPSDIPTQYTAQQPPMARPETEPIDYPSVMDGYPQPGQQVCERSRPDGRLAPRQPDSAARLPQAGQPIPGQLDSYPPPNAAAPQAIGYRVHGVPAQPGTASVDRRAARPPASAGGADRRASELRPRSPGRRPARRGGAARATGRCRRQGGRLPGRRRQGRRRQGRVRVGRRPEPLPRRRSIAEQVDQAATRRNRPATSSIPTVGQQILPEPIGQGGFTEGYQAGFRAALEGKAQVAASEKRSREVDPNAEPVPLAGLDPANQARSRGRALDPNNDPLTAPMHRGGV